MASAPAAVLEDPNAAPTTGYAAPLMPGGFGGLFTLPPTRPCANVAYQVGKQLSMSDHRAPKRYGVRDCDGTQANGEASGRRPQPTRQPLGVWHHPTPRRTQRTVFLKEAE